MNDVGLRRVAVAHLGDVAHVDHGAVDGLDRQVAEIGEPRGRVVELERVLERSDLLRADRGDQVLRGERVGDILSRQPARLQGDRIEIDLDLAQLAAKRPGDRRSRHRHQRRADLVDGEVGEPLLGEALAGKRDEQDRHGRRAVIEDQRRRRAGRHRLDQGLRNRGDLSVGGADVGVGLKENLDHADAGVGGRLDVLDVVDRRRQRALELGGDAPRHVVGRQAGVLPDDADDRDADVGKDVGGRAQRRERAEDQDQQRQHDEGVGPRERNADKGDH